MDVTDLQATNTIHGVQKAAETAGAEYVKIALLTAPGEERARELQGLLKAWIEFIRRAGYPPKHLGLLNEAIVDYTEGRCK